MDKAFNLSRFVLDKYREYVRFREQHRVFQHKSVDTWIETVDRALHKEHDADVRQAYPNMRSYFGLTMLKVNAAVAKLESTYSHAIDAPFVLKPSSTPELNESSQEKLALLLKRRLFTKQKENGFDEADFLNDTKTGFHPSVLHWLKAHRDELQESILNEERAMAKKAAVHHHALLREQMMKGGWVGAASLAFRDLVAMPYCVINANYGAVRDYYWDGDKPKHEMKFAPRFEHVDVRQAYHAPDAKSAQDGSGFIEVITRSRYELVDLLYEEDDDGNGVYDRTAITDVLAEFNTRCLSWLGNVADVSGITDKTPWVTQPNQRIKCILFQGYISGDELSQLGYSGYGGRKDMHNVHVEVCGERVIRFDPDLKERTYYSASYASDNAYASASVGMMLHDRQRDINLLLYSKNRNSWHSSGPSLFMNGAFFKHPEDVSIDPYSQSMADPKNQTGVNWAFQQMNIQPTFAALHAEIRRVMILADEECGVPSLFSGMSRGGVSRSTLGGAILEQTNGEMGMNAAMLNVDRLIIEPMVRHVYFNNLVDETLPERIRGDIEIEGRGINALREKELQQRLSREMMPILAATTQQGMTPQPMYRNALRDMYSNAGIDTSLMYSAEAQSELNAFGLNPPNVQDGRTYTPQAPQLGVN